MDGGQLLHAEKVSQVGRHTGEAAAVAGNHSQYQDFKPQRFRSRSQLPEGEDFKSEENHIGHSAADPVRQGRPDDAATAIDDADDAYQGCRLSGAHADEVLGHRRRHCQKADAASDIGEENPPQSVPFPSAHGFLASQTFYGCPISFSLLPFRFEDILYHHRDLPLLRRTDIRSG